MVVAVWVGGDVVVYLIVVNSIFNVKVIGDYGGKVVEVYFWVV